MVAGQSSDGAAANEPVPSGLLLIASAAVLWATIGLFTPALLDRGLPPVEIGFWRAAFGGGLFVLHGSIRRQVWVRDKADVGRLVVFGVVAVGLFYVALAAAIEHGGVSLAWILLYTGPAWVAIGAATLLQERVDGFRWALVAATIGGVFLVALGGGEGITVTAVALAWGLVAGLAYASWYLVGKPLLVRYSPVTISAWILVAGAVVLLPFVSFRALPATAWLLLIGLGVVSTYLPALAYYSGLAVVDASRAAIVATIEPVVAVAFGVIFAGERLSTLAGFGGVLVLTAAAVSASRRA